ncbi:unnamed protein product [Protopolystoma xenopodis]|uniref:Uncharacterized protein n=1 Tax=Protopolystoma xenopodis TaxID=117903 RepID=A0A3S5FGF8_9PLAT|nr:unnamed protein product [Protopolystoma xenopodis]
MVSGTDDDRHTTDESSVRSHRGRKMVSRSLLHPIQHTKVQDNPLAISDLLELDPDLPRTKSQVATIDSNPYRLMPMFMESHSDSAEIGQARSA